MSAPDRQADLEAAGWVLSPSTRRISGIRSPRTGTCRCCTRACSSPSRSPKPEPSWNGARTMSRRTEAEYYAGRDEHIAACAEAEEIFGTDSPEHLAASAAWEEFSCAWPGPWPEPEGRVRPEPELEAEP